MSSTLANLFGFAGMGCIIFAYWYITGRERPNPFVQHGVNLAGAAMLTVSLLVNMNPASFVLEFFWAAIAIWGLVKAFRQKASAGNSTSQDPPPGPLPQAGGGE